MTDEGMLFGFEIPAAVRVSLAKTRLMPAPAAGATFGGVAVAKLVAAALAIATITVAYQPAVAYGEEPSTMANTTQPAAMHIVRSNGQTYLTGAEGIEWGNITEQQNSVIAATAAAMKVIGENVTNEELMGLGGSAFRVQIHDGPTISPASPFALCGHDDLSPALAALGYGVEWIHTTDSRGTPFADAIETARAAIQQSIDQGLPVLATSEECGLIVGYSTSGDLMLRPYSPKAPGYITQKKWPWSIGILHQAGQAAAPRQRLLASLRQAIALANTPRFVSGKQFSADPNAKEEIFLSGFEAYTQWAKRLRSGNLKDAFGNGYAWGTLSTARQMAGRFLRAAAQQNAPPLKDHLLAAATQYERINQHMNQKRPDLPQAWFLMPWDMKQGWKPEYQLAQPSHLRRKRHAETSLA